MKRFVVGAMILLFLTTPCGKKEITYEETPENYFTDVHWYFSPKETEVQGFEIQAKILHELETTPLKEFINLKKVLISFTEAPDAPDEKKEAVLKMVDNNLTYLSQLQKCPNLESLAFQVGEKIFIKSTENLSDDEEKEINLRRAAQRYGGLIRKMLPNVTVYFHNWGW